MDHIIKQKKDKERNEERFEPIPLYVPQFEMPGFDPKEDEDASKTSDQDTERGVYIMEI